ncbi:TPA: hypothetical protein H1V01_004385 [Salmonella enterica]|nr:hypothetical protein [Salmonella enterica]
MTAGKQKKTPVIVMKKKRHIISPPPTEEHVITGSGSHLKTTMLAFIGFFCSH